MENEKGKVKLKHIEACLNDESQYHKSAGFENVEIMHQAASCLCLSDIDTKTTFLSHRLKAPLMIAPMTGGMEMGALLNERFAKAAEHFGIAMGVGSQRLALEDESVKNSFSVRKFAKTALIFANLGAAQLVRGLNSEHALRAVAMIEAQALFIHLNPLQEACKWQGDVNFKNLLPKIAEVAQRLEREGIPVLVREVGFGLSPEAVERLLSSKIAGIDCAGAGGTSWAKVEALCATKPQFRRLGMLFGEWGIKTVSSIENVRKVDPNIPLIATGGLRSGLDIAKAIALGADLGSMAQPMLKQAVISEEALFSFIEECLFELRVAMFAAGANDLSALKALGAVDKADSIGKIARV